MFPESTAPDHLPDHCMAVLYGLVTSFPGKGKMSLLKLVRSMGVNDSSGRLLDAETLSALLESLQREHWITLEERPEGRYFNVASERRNRVLLSLLDSPDLERWLHEIKDGLPLLSEWQTPSRSRILQDLWLNLLSGNLGGLAQSLRLATYLFFHHQSPAPHPVHSLTSDAEGLEVVARLDADIRLLLVEDHLNLINTQLGPAGHSYPLAQREMEARPNRMLGLELALQALWRGDWGNLEHIDVDELTLLQQTVHLMLRGHVSEALRGLRTWLTEIRRLTKKRKIDLPPVLNIFYCLALVAENDPLQRASLKQAIALGTKENYGEAYKELQGLLEQMAGDKPSLPSFLPSTLNGLDGLVRAIALYWQDAPQVRQDKWRITLQDYRDELARDEYLWLAAEFDALIAVQFGQPRLFAEVHQRAGLQPLVGLCQRQEAWEHALNALSQLRPGKAPATLKADEKNTRLAWSIELDAYWSRVEPREQKRNAKGQWSKGRAVAFKRLVEDVDLMDFLCEQDRQTIGAIQVSYHYGRPEYELAAVHALPRLVGHPAVYWQDAPDVRIDVHAGQAALHLQNHAEQIRLHLEPPGIVEAGETYTHKETPTRLVVYPINRELRKIIDIVGQGLSVPTSAKAQLIEAVSAIAPLLPIHSNIPELTGHLDREPADTRLYAHLLPLAEGVRLQLLVRPLADGSWFRPGHGAENLLSERDGKPLQVTRDLAGERHVLQQVLHSCPGLAYADSDGQEWQLDQPQHALQLLSELHALDGEQLHCIWPEGERMRIKARPGLPQLTLGLRQQGDWFVLQGNITLDDGKVLQLKELMELLKASPGRFLRLNERDWLALDESLRKRLDELAHLTDRVSDQGLRLSALTSPLLASLAQEVGQFDADANWQTHLEKLQSLRDYQPLVPGTLQAELRDYQHDGFVWLARLAQWGVGACLADDMGLGKTVQTLALLLQRASLGPQLVVAPTSVTLNWQAESVRFAPSLRLRLYQQQRSLNDLGPGDLVIVSYGLLQLDAGAFAEQHWTSVVLDEAQAIKNAQTKRSQAVMALQADFRMVATGTPLENHLGELWNLFRFINPGLLGSQDSFAARFATPIEQGDVAARRALKALIQPFILRRLKSQVLAELPARTEITYKVPLSEEEAHQYEALRQQAVDNLSRLDPQAGKSMQVLAEITRLRRFCCHPSLVLPGSTLQSSKLQAFTEIVSELLENRHKALVFSQFVDHLSIVRAWLDQAGIAYQYLDGATPVKERQSRVNAFQSGVGDIFLISLKAGGSGLNLTAADYVIHLDPWWNPAVEDQASDRAHRMGQQRPVTIYRLVTENSIEEQIVGLHGRKRDLADSLLDGGEISAKLDADALLELLKG
ncbi:DEAD/DEAH box helicase [Pseudomonas sp. 14P_8.1_Bac3]|uniref:DEAD/DEAH box helicase n=1 Tax=Pseudomonas sp. 14P_8.1_Bac3 TaxID=2971621 RepID=UPI0021C5C32F|nr:DEAD/DEAH box helicase [Pseudomonas sp. 14P_8.1_Bac3]MCU1759858.1 DEAD/DEAH box helicase [Pseudomonas sp. 14P_8.1_Bac3]